MRWEKCRDWLLDGKIDRIGLSGTTLNVARADGKPPAPLHLAAANHRTAVAFLLDWLEAQPVFASLTAVGHRVVPWWNIDRVVVW